MPDLTNRQLAVLERLRKAGFQFVAFPMYANYVGVRRGNCAALLAPVDTTGFKVFGDAAYLLSGNLSARIAQQGRQWFVWKKEKLEATPERLAEIDNFAEALAALLIPTI
jgi:hypothetical protein